MNSKELSSRNNNPYKEEPKSSDFFTNEWKNNSIVDIRCNTSNKLWQAVDNSKNRVLTEEEERILFDRYIKTWDKAAFDKIIVWNLRFVKYLVKHFYAGLKTVYNCRDIHLNDLIQEWNVWLIEAAQEYNPDENKNLRFITYAQHRIKNCILNYIKYENRFFWAESWTPESRIKQMNKYVENFIQKNEREPQDEELEEFYEDINPEYNSNNLAKVRYYKFIIDGSLSLDMSIDEAAEGSNLGRDEIKWYMGDLIGREDWEWDWDTYLRDLLVDMEWKEEKLLEKDSLEYDTRKAVYTLSCRRQHFLWLSYGLNLWPRNPPIKEYSIEELALILWTRGENIKDANRKSIKELSENEDVQKLLKKYLW